MLIKRNFDSVISDVSQRLKGFDLSSMLSHLRDCTGMTEEREFLHLLHDVTGAMLDCDIRLFSEHTRRAILFDLLKMAARQNQLNPSPIQTRKLQLGAGRRKIDGWLNADVRDSDVQVDVSSGRLPWQQGSFDVVLAQHLIEHLEIETELIPLLRELKRVCADKAVIWLSCPSLAKICKAYVEDKGRALLEERLQRWPTYALLIPPDIGSQDIINNLFHQWGEHRNLFDMELIAWVLRQAGYTTWKEVSEKELLAEEPTVLPRNDACHALYVRVMVEKSVGNEDAPSQYATLLKERKAQLHLLERMREGSRADADIHSLKQWVTRYVGEEVSRQIDY